jgi:hypothetical protein
MASNDDWVVPAGERERRYVLNEVSTSISKTQNGSTRSLCSWTTAAMPRCCSTSCTNTSAIGIRVRCQRIADWPTNRRYRCRRSIHGGFCATCGVTFIERSSLTKSSASQALPAPSVDRGRSVGTRFGHVQRGHRFSMPRRQRQAGIDQQAVAVQGY